eukprot:CAMPEP_0197263882 /NCGR_PEP_ID=MMETSP1432-20130617/1439_1 /TAXON_ID=44447 /ORGANISM="Pseudo-nitzschia delicatissima, Strain UNC1205" /LENGTH=369 /DNA_ID=CAMNT_0042728441 /DNA_START=79 /DNA_END=1188 /DNA_ORIENTATION=+
MSNNNRDDKKGSMDDDRGPPPRDEVAVDLLRPVEEAAEDVEADPEAFRDLDLRRIEGDLETEDVADLLPEEGPADALGVSADPGAARHHLAEDAMIEIETGGETIIIATGEGLLADTGADLLMTTVEAGVATTTVAAMETDLPEEDLAGGGPPQDPYNDQYGPPGPRGGDPYGPPRGRGGPPPLRGGGGGGRRDRNRREENDPGISLLVRNIGPHITNHDLVQAFGRIGEVRDVYIPRDYHSQQAKGFAFIEYADPDQAREARDEMDRFNMKGCVLEVVFAQERRKSPNEMRGRVVNQQNHGGRGDRSSSFERHQKRRRDEGRRNNRDDKDKNGDGSNRRLADRNSDDGGDDKVGKDREKSSDKKDGEE